MAERGGNIRVYVLELMSVTFPTFHAERSLLNSPASENTAPRVHVKMGGKKGKISAGTKEYM